jgi:hypothetical protein
MDSLKETVASVHEAVKRNVNIHAKHADVLEKDSRRVRDLQMALDILRTDDDGADMANVVDIDGVTAVIKVREDAYKRVQKERTDVNNAIAQQKSDILAAILVLHDAYMLTELRNEIGFSAGVDPFVVKMADLLYSTVHDGHDLRTRPPIGLSSVLPPADGAPWPIQDAQRPVR